MSKAGKWLMIVGGLVLAAGLLGAFSPWTIDAYIWLFPGERTAYANDPAGGPYPEMAFLLLAMIGFFILMAGFAFRFGTKGPSANVGGKK
jgi:hypothetical protein